MDNLDQFNWAKEFMGFSDADAEHLKTLAPIVAEHGQGITDSFYETLQSYPDTAAKVEGRVEGLKKTHLNYMGELVAGDYGEAYFKSRTKVGEVHVQQGIKPHWVEAVMSIIRAQLIGLISSHFDDADERKAKCQAVIKICDLDLLLINFAYADERLERLASFTGMTRRLIENVISMPKKKKK